MNKNAESRARRLFAGVNSSLSRTDPEFVEIISNFSQDETANANILTEKERMLCILAALLGCQGMGEFQNMLHAALNIGVDPVAIKETIYQAMARRFAETLTAGWRTTALETIIPATA